MTVESNSLKMHEIYTLSFLAAQQHHRHLCNYKVSSSKWGLSLGSLHLTLGFLSVIFGILGILVEYHANKYGSALWCGLIFESTGAFGVIASKKWYSRTYLKCFCLASTLATLTAILLLALTCVGITEHYVHFEPNRHLNVANYMANVSANVMVLTILEIAVSLTSITVSVRAMRWRYRPPPPLANPVVIRETFMAQSPTCETPDTYERHQYVTVPDVLLQGVMPSAFGITRNSRPISFGIANTQILEASNLIGLDEPNDLPYHGPQIQANSSQISEIREEKIKSSLFLYPKIIGHDRNY